MPLGTLDSLDETNRRLQPLAAWMFKGPRTTWENIIFSKRVWATSQSDIDGEDSILGFFEERFGESGWSREI